jgi:hypothetical protein
MVKTAAENAQPALKSLIEKDLAAVQEKSVNFEPGFVSRWLHLDKDNLWGKWPRYDADSFVDLNLNTI